MKTEDICDIKMHPQDIKPPEEAYLGVNVSAVLNTIVGEIDPKKLLEMQNNFTKFYIELSQQMMMRFQLESEMFKLLSNFTPTAVRLFSILKHFPGVIENRRLARNRQRIQCNKMSGFQGPRNHCQLQ